MAVQTHINITIDFSKWDGRVYDLRIPTHQPVKQLLLNIAETLKLIDYHVTDGDIVKVL
jgi:uncharacterized ubiquitin-like protein YukD